MRERWRHWRRAVGARPVWVLATVGAAVVALAAFGLWLWQGRTPAAATPLEHTLTRLVASGGTRFEATELTARIAAMRGELDAGRPTTRVWSYYEMLRRQVDAGLADAPAGVRNEAQRRLQEVARGLALGAEPADRALADLAALLEQHGL